MHGECVNNSLLRFYENALSFLLAETMLSHSSVYFILCIICFTTFSHICINLLIVLEAVGKTFPLCETDLNTCVFEYLIIYCRYDAPDNYVLTSVIANNFDSRGKVKCAKFQVHE